MSKSTTASGTEAVGFVRVKLLQCERGNGVSPTTVNPAFPRQDSTEVFDPYVAVKVKEAEQTPGQIDDRWVHEPIYEECVFEQAYACIRIQLHA